MLTLKKHADNVELCKLKQGKKTIPVYWHPVKNESLRMAVSDVKGFNNEMFRDRFQLSPKQSDELLDHLNAGTTPEGPLQKTFFKVKRYITDSLYNEMNLMGSNQQLHIPFPEGNNTWGEHCIYAGASGSGKTYDAISRIIHNLNGPEKHRRRFTIISNGWHKDKTLQPLKVEKYRNYVHGIDVSHTSLTNSEHETPKQFFEKEVLPFVENASPGQICFFDDNMDSCCPAELRQLINRGIRTFRHNDVGIQFVLHNIRSGIWSSTASSNCKYFVLFPRSQRGKVKMYLKDEMGCTLRESREHVADFSSSGRAMYCRLFSPQCLINKKMIRLL